MMNGDRVVTNVLPFLQNTFGRTYALYVGIATLGIGNTVAWLVDVEVYTRVIY